MPLDLHSAVVVAASGFGIWWFAFRQRLSYIPGPPSPSWLIGNLIQLFTENAWGFHAYVYKTFGAVTRIHTMCNAEELLVYDPLALQHILIKEVHIYEEAAATVCTNRVLFGRSLMSVYEDAHKRQRKMLNPLFSTKQLQGVLPLMHPVANEMRDRIARELKDGPQEINLMKWFSRTALEYIGRGGFGYSFGPLDSPEAAAFSDSISSVGFLLLQTVLLRALFLPYVIDLGTPSLRQFVLKYIPSANCRRLSNVVNTLALKSKEIVESRKAALSASGENFDEGKDILSTLLKANMDASVEDRLPDEEVLNNISLFIFGGEDTTSHLTCRIMDQLAKHPDIQSKLREEIITARKDHDGSDFDYDTLMDLPYLDAICRETVRVFPPVPVLPRIARQDTVLPLSWPFTAADGKTQITEIPIKKGQGVMVSVLGANHSTRIWGEDAEQWKPERWLNNKLSNVATEQLPGVYHSIMTFLGGPRACIGFTFAELEMKLVVSTLVENFVFEEGPHISWEMSAIVRPIVTGKRGANAQLPLKVSLA